VWSSQVLRAGTAVCFSGASNVVVADDDAKLVAAFTLDGKFLRSVHQDRRGLPLANVTMMRVTKQNELLLVSAGECFTIPWDRDVLEELSEPNPPAAGKPQGGTLGKGVAASCESRSPIRVTFRRFRRVALEGSQLFLRMAVHEASKTRSSEWQVLSTCSYPDFDWKGSFEFSGSQAPGSAVRVEMWRRDDIATEFYAGAFIPTHVTDAKGRWFVFRDQFGNACGEVFAALSFPSTRPALIATVTPGHGRSPVAREEREGKYMDSSQVLEQARRPREYDPPEHASRLQKESDPDVTGASQVIGRPATISASRVTCASEPFEVSAASGTSGVTSASGISEITGASESSQFTGALGLENPEDESEEKKEDDLDFAESTVEELVRGVMYRSCFRRIQALIRMAASSTSLHGTISEALGQDGLRALCHYLGHPQARVRKAAADLLNLLLPKHASNQLKLVQGLDHPGLMLANSNLFFFHIPSAIRERYAQSCVHEDGLDDEQYIQYLQQQLGVQKAPGPTGNELCMVKAATGEWTALGFAVTDDAVRGAIFRKQRQVSWTQGVRLNKLYTRFQVLGAHDLKRDGKTGERAVPRKVLKGDPVTNVYVNLSHPKVQEDCALITWTELRKLFWFQAFQSARAGNAGAVKQDVLLCKRRGVVQGRAVNIRLTNVRSSGQINKIKFDVCESLTGEWYSGSSEVSGGCDALFLEQTAIDRLIDRLRFSAPSFEVTYEEGSDAREPPIQLTFTGRKMASRIERKGKSAKAVLQTSDSSPNEEGGAKVGAKKDWDGSELQALADVMPKVAALWNNAAREAAGLLLLETAPAIASQLPPWFRDHRKRMLRACKLLRLNIEDKSVLRLWKTCEQLLRSVDRVNSSGARQCFLARQSHGPMRRELDQRLFERNLERLRRTEEQNRAAREEQAERDRSRLRKIIAERERAKAKLRFERDQLAREAKAKADAERERAARIHAAWYREETRAREIEAALLKEEQRKEQQRRAEARRKNDEETERERLRVQEERRMQAQLQYEQDRLAAELRRQRVQHITRPMDALSVESLVESSIPEKLEFDHDEARAKLARVQVRSRSRANKLASGVHADMNKSHVFGRVSNQPRPPPNSSPGQRVHARSGRNLS